MGDEAAPVTDQLEAKVTVVGALWAYRLGQSLLADAVPQRWQHSMGVAERALACRSVVGESAGVLVSAALLHDVGYAPELVATGFHALDGARHLRGLGVDDEVVCLVAHHSHADIEAGIRGLTEELTEFANGEPILTDALVFCDMTTDPSGRPTEVGRRLAEIVERAGEGSVVTEFVGRASAQLRSTTARFEGLLQSSVA